MAVMIFRFYLLFNDLAFEDILYFINHSLKYYSMSVYYYYYWVSEKAARR